LLDDDVHEGSSVDHLDATVMSYKKPLPDVTDPLNTPFWEGLNKHELRAQKCSACKTLRLPAAPVCPECLARDHEWVAVADRGTLWSYVVYHKALSAPFAGDVPYTVGIVELEHGLHLLSRIDAPENRVTIGDRMAARYDSVTPGVSLLTWVPERNTDA
jgi:uncharacterized protein